MSFIRRLAIACIFIIATFAPRISAQEWVTNGLIAYYPFSGNAQDASGNSYDGVPEVAELSEDRFGSPANSYAFDGSSSVISVAHNERFNFPTNGDFSISLWAVLNSEKQNYLIAKDNGAGPQTKWIFGQGISPENPGVRTLFFHFNNPGNVGHWLCDSRPYRVAPNVWRYYVVTKLSSTYRIYVDGQLFDSDTTQSGISENIATDMTFGRAEGSSIHGKLDEIRIYDRALAAAEVEALFRMEAPVRLNIRKAIYLDSSELRVGSNYQLQASADLITWSNIGPAFLATNGTWRTTNYWDVEHWSELFFRLQ